MDSHNHEDTTSGVTANQTPVNASDKKAFVEPLISQPIDVLEATTFFQAVESGATGLRDPEATPDLR